MQAKIKIMFPSISAMVIYKNSKSMGRASFTCLVKFPSGIWPFHDGECTIREVMVKTTGLRRDKEGRYPSGGLFAETKDGSEIKVQLFLADNIQFGSMLRRCACRVIIRCPPGHVWVGKVILPKGRFCLKDPRAMAAVTAKGTIVLQE